MLIISVDIISGILANNIFNKFIFTIEIFFSKLFPKYNLIIIPRISDANVPNAAPINPYNFIKIKLKEILNKAAKIQLSNFYFLYY